MIERAFDVACLIGTNERAAAIGTCEHGSYHILSDYGVVELLALEDGSKEIVGTGFFNSAMPLFRYRTGDAVIPTVDGTTCPCGRALPLVQQIVGRVDDYIRTPDGRYIGMMAIIFDWVNGLWEGQIVQEKINELRIRVVPMGQLTQEMKQDIEGRRDRHRTSNEDHRGGWKRSHELRVFTNGCEQAVNVHIWTPRRA